MQELLVQQVQECVGGDTAVPCHNRDGVHHHGELRRQQGCAGDGQEHDLCVHIRVSSKFVKKLGEGLSEENGLTCNIPPVAV